MLVPNYVATGGPCACPQPGQNTGLCQEGYPEEELSAKPPEWITFKT